MNFGQKEASVMIGTWVLNRVETRPLILVCHKIDKNEILFYTRLYIPPTTRIFHFGD